LKSETLNPEQSSYRQIFKATSLFGGVQAFNTIISIIRSKFVAVLLGPLGTGIFGLLGSTTGFVYALTNCGLGTIAVKNVAAAAATGDDAQVLKVVTVLRKMVWTTGILGMAAVAILSPWLSELTFGNRDYTLSIIWISVTLLFQQLSSGQMVVLQGLRKLQYLARANVIGAVIGLLISVPIFYIWRLNGIVPVIIISSVTTMFLSWYFARKTGVRSIKISKDETIKEGKKMLTMGFAFSLNGIIISAFSYLVRIYISNRGGVEQVGLYNSGFTLINTYVGMVFAGMATDYYPRLSAVAGDNIKSRMLINQQAEIAILILAPFLTVFLVFINWITIILYSSKFVAINEMIHWAALGVYFKAASWSIAFLFLAKGASKLFFWNEVLANLYILVFNIAGYRVAGLQGLGFSFLAGYFVYLIQVFLVTRLKYSFSFNRAFYQVAGFQFLLGLLCFVIMRSISSPWTYILGSFLIIISTFYSFRELEKRIGLKEVIIKRLNDLRN
jgi:O-antigen/teichoic acid export membrane protein